MLKKDFLVLITFSEFVDDAVCIKSDFFMRIVIVVYYFVQILYAILISFFYNSKSHLSKNETFCLRQCNKWTEEKKLYV